MGNVKIDNILKLTVFYVLGGLFLFLPVIVLFFGLCFWRQ